MNNQLIKINLEHKVKIEHFQAKMSVGLREKHDEIIAVLLLTQEMGKITPEIISEKLLIGFPAAGAQILLDYIRNLGLIDLSGKLTEVGLEIVNSNSNMILIPEDDIYDIYCVNDPLVPQVILDFNPVERKDLKKETLSQNVQKQQIEQLPNWLVEVKNLVLLKENAKTHEQTAVEIFNIDPKGYHIFVQKEKKLTLTLSINQNNENSLECRENYEIPKTPPENLNFEFVWSKILDLLQIYQDWEYQSELGKYVLKLSNIDVLTEDQIENFSWTLPHRDIRIDSFGMFSCRKIDNIPVFPKSIEDAQIWFERLLIKRINDYLFLEKYAQLCNEIAAIFGVYQDQLNFPSIQEIGQKINDQDAQEKKNHADIHSRKFWQVYAPIDLPIEDED